MKKILAFLLSFCILFCLTACRKHPSSGDNPSAGTSHSSGTDFTSPDGTQSNIPETETTTGDESSTEATEKATVPEEATVPTSSAQPTETAPIQQPVHTHSYNSEITKAASCTKTGIKTFSCTCGSTYTEAIPTSSHSWGNWLTVKEPTATTEGISQRNCSSCNSPEQTTIPKLPADESAPVTQAHLDAIEARFLQLVNAERSSVGVSTLTIDKQLEGFAQIRSIEVTELFSHTRPNGQSWTTVVDYELYPYALIAENLVKTSHLVSGTYTGTDISIPAEHAGEPRSKLLHYNASRSSKTALRITKI